jgi:hypothetical protein
LRMSDENVEYLIAKVKPLIVRTHECLDMVADIVHP